jgi:hypothetical protein
MLPTVGSDTLKIFIYAAEVAGRALGVASMPNLVPDAERRATIEKAGNAIATVTNQVTNAYVARLLAEFVNQRIAVGKGRGVDKGFDAGISVVSETIRTSLADRNTRNPDYLAIFPDGAEAYTSPTIKEDADLAVDLRKSVADSTLTVKTDVLALLDTLIPLVEPVVTAIRDGEKEVNTLFQTELNGRKQIIDCLWEQRKVVETALGRSGRGLARFIFFDFRSPGGPSGEPAAESPPGSSATPLPTP